MAFDISVLRQLGVSGLVDILIMTAIVYGVLVWLRQPRACSVLLGALIIGTLYLLARQFNLVLTSSALEAFFAVLLVAAIVIFRNELRRVVEQIAAWSRRASRLRGKPSVAPPDQTIQVLVHTLSGLARRRVGALVVVEGEEPVEPHLEGGTLLDGELSEPLLESLFDAHSIGHDGAVIVRQSRVRKFGVHLPLSTAFQSLGHRGTRHAAALGLAEQCDALSLVVSEERGEISVARAGELRAGLSAEQLTAELESFVARSRAALRPGKKAALKEVPAIMAALCISVLLWFVLVHGSTVTQRTITIPVRYADLPAHQTVAEISPAEVTLTFAGPRREFYFLGPSSVRLELPLADAEPGPRVVHLSATDISFPTGVTIKRIMPTRITVRVSPRQPATKASGAPSASSKKGGAGH